MAVEESEDVIQLELEADIYTLKRSGGKVSLSIGGRPIPQDIFSAKVSEERELSIIGRKLGKINAEQCVVNMSDGNNTNSLENIRGALGKWYPPGNVKHVHKIEDFDELKADGILVAKFSAEWCGPCKMVAPRIDALSTRYPDVKFVHVDSDELAGLFKREGIKAYPTFKFFLNGTVQNDKEVKGADANKVEQSVKALGGVEKPVASSGPVPDGSIKLVCARDVLRVVKTSSGTTFAVNGETMNPCPQVELDPKTKEVTFGRGAGKVYTEGGIDLEATAKKLASWFPSKVKHVHSIKEFDELVQTGITVVKYSATWCPPCKAIKGDYIRMSNEAPNVKFLHVDVDERSDLSGREGIEAMPTFHFFVDGSKKTSLMIRGANIAQVKKNLKNLGVNVN